MPKQTRHQVKRTLDQVIGNLDNASEYVIGLYAIYDGVHNDIADRLAIAYNIIEKIKPAIQSIRDEI